MIDEVGGDQLVDHVDVAGVEGLLQKTASQRLVALSRHSATPSFDVRRIAPTLRPEWRRINLCQHLCVARRKRGRGGRNPRDRRTSCAEHSSLHFRLPSHWWSPRWQARRRYERTGARRPTSCCTTRTPHSNRRATPFARPEVRCCARTFESESRRRLPRIQTSSPTSQPRKRWKARRGMHRSATPIRRCGRSCPPRIGTRCGTPHVAPTAATRDATSPRRTAVSHSPTSSGECG